MDRFSLLSLLILALTTAACAVRADEDPLIRQVVSDGEDDDLLNADHHFTLFKSKYGKSYATQEEHDYRLSVFKANLRRAKRHQMLDPSAVHGVTKFSDLTPKEFRRTYLGIRKSSSSKQKLKLKLPADAHAAEILPTSDLPSDFDWRDYGAVTAVKDQVCLACTPTSVYVILYTYTHMYVLSDTEEVDRAHVDRAGRLVPPERWKEQIFWRPVS